MIKTKFQRFWNDTSGAVTLPWIAAAAAVGIVGATATGMMQQPSEKLADDNKSFFESVDNTGGDSY